VRPIAAKVGSRPIINTLRPSLVQAPSIKRTPLNAIEGGPNEWSRDCRRRIETRSQSDRYYEAFLLTLSACHTAILVEPTVAPAPATQPMPTSHAAECKVANPICVQHDHSRKVDIDLSDKRQELRKFCLMIEKPSNVADSGPCGQLIPVDVGTENALMWAAIPL